MIKKKLLNSKRLRRIDGGFSFIPHRFLTDGFLASLSQRELLLYLFHVLVSALSSVVISFLVEVSPTGIIDNHLNVSTSDNSSIHCAVFSEMGSSCSNSTPNRSRAEGDNSSGCASSLTPIPVA